jgi:hypothetical protein
MQRYNNGEQWLKPQAHLKRDVHDRAMEGSVIIILNIWKALIPCTWMLGFLHTHDMHNHSIDHLCFSIYMGVKGSQFGQLGVHQRP